LTDLDEPSLNMLMSEVRRCAAALQSISLPDKINIAALGNQVRQLHVHVIARRIGDAAWPKPVWGAVPSIPYDDTTLTELTYRIAVTLT
jgi:diadenosine tetraphosphate (Ap4A) HIT family hydrolase